jgi:hypothetical protein
VVGGAAGLTRGDCLAQIAIERARADDFGSSRMLAPERRRDLALAIEGALLHEPEAWEDDEA